MSSLSLLQGIHLSATTLLAPIKVFSFQAVTATKGGKLLLSSVSIWPFQITVS